MPETYSNEIFFVSSHGLAGDHYFDWYAKALNAHPEIYIYMGESVRAKYFKERSRKDRPDLFEYVRFLMDFGAAYRAIGECYAYRSYQLEKLRPVYNDRIRFINLVRHPYCWLEFYTSWRCANMNMSPDDTSGIDHEWSVTCHSEIAKFHLKPYQREDIHIWSSYQGMIILNRMLSDLNPGVRNIRIEHVVEDRAAFIGSVDYLTHGAITYESQLLEHIYGWTGKSFRKEGTVLKDPVEVHRRWPDWKQEAFEKIVKPETRDMFARHGYRL